MRTEVGSIVWKGSSLSPRMDSDKDPSALQVITVDIGGGRSGRIEFREGDSPEAHARAFMQEHGLPEKVLPHLTQHIHSNLQKVQERHPPQHADAGSAAQGKPPSKTTRPASSRAR